MEIDPISTSNNANSTPYPDYFTPKFWQQELGFLGNQIHQSDAQWKQSQSDMQAQYTDTLN
ncbi:MAG: hypothetical protein NTX49_06075 [Chlamydiae bacterium]|nr:hypothetical protein [Chlamydiota bacterium]